MITRNVSYGELYQLLAGLHFVDESSEHRWKVKWTRLSRPRNAIS
jgi:hypothetical protein